MYCRSCGTLNENGKIFCESCKMKITVGYNYCLYCGAKTKSTDKKCEACQKELDTNNFNNQVDQRKHEYKNHYNNSRRKTVIDEPNTLANFATFCCNPIVGLVLYIVWKDEKPIAAKSVCNWTIAAIFFYALVYIIMFIFEFSLLSQR